MAIVFLSFVNSLCNFFRSAFLVLICWVIAALCLIRTVAPLNMSVYNTIILELRINGQFSYLNSSIVSFIPESVGAGFSSLS